MKCQTSESWSKTRYQDIIEAAGMMGIPVKQAFAMRHHFIDTSIKILTDEINRDAEYMLTCDDEIEFRFYFESMSEKMRQVAKLERSRPKKPTEGAITDSDIEVARQYPVDKLIEFKRGKSTAFCHDDKSPSMFFGFRKNLAVCPVCDLKFGPIDILIERDGYSFTAAVKHLSGA